MKHVGQQRKGQAPGAKISALDPCVNLVKRVRHMVNLAKKPF